MRRALMLMLEALAHRLVRGTDPERLRAAGDLFRKLAHRADAQLRGLTAGEIPSPRRRSFDASENLTVSVRTPVTPWSCVEVPAIDIPGMITAEERRYYAYLGRFYSGRGEAVELGPWLGCSTYHILKGLLPNPHFGGRQLHVFDDFVWRADWMNDRVGPEERLPHHGDFRHLFDKHTTGLGAHLRVQPRRIANYDGNDAVPLLCWDGGPVELLYVDCGRTYEVNDAWYRIFTPSFIPGVTLIVMQDWGLHAELPVKWYNQTKQFTDSKGATLEMIHELRDGGAATFIFRGAGGR